ncbi:MAG: hypothetical protein ACKOC5_02770 [Chloroflexota bacterium]
MKYRSMVAIFILMLLVTACTAPAVSKPEAPAQPADSAYPAVEAYPPSAPGLDNGAYPAVEAYPQSAPGLDNSAYPAGSEPQVAATVAPVYPDLTSGSQVPWEQAEAMVLNGEVQQISVAKDNIVTLALKDGRSFTSQMPEAGLVETLMSRCGIVCQDIQIVTQ